MMVKRQQIPLLAFSYPIMFGLGQQLSLGLRSCDRSHLGHRMGHTLHTER